MKAWPREGYGAFLLAVPALMAVGEPAEQAQLEASVGSHRDSFGWSVALHGDTAVVGAINADPPVDAGAAYVFQWGGEGWQEVAALTSGDPEVFGLFGRSVSVFGDTALVGAQREDTRLAVDAGAAYVFERRGTTWVEDAELIASDGKIGAGFGISASVHADTALIGAWADPEKGQNAGAAYVFTREPTGWSEQAKLLAPDGAADDLFGISVSLSGDTAVVGSANEDNLNGLDAGSVYVFVRNGHTWIPQAKLKASDGEPNDIFGFSVSVDGDTLVVGAESAEVSGEQGAGAAYVFVRDGTVWSEQAKLTASDGLAGDSFGVCVSVSGNTVAVGAYLDDAPGLVSSGSGYVFERTGTTWSERAKLTASAPTPLEQYGFSCCVSEGRVLFGIPDKETSSGLNPGAVSVVEHGAPVTYCTPGISANGCRALVSAGGVASETAPSGFTLHAVGVEGNTGGLFFFGASGRQANPWGNGTSYQCVVPPVSRSRLLAASGTSGSCNGSFSTDLNARWCPTCPKPLHNPGAGAVVQAQLWYRDPFSTSNQTTGLSNALEFEICP